MDVFERKLGAFLRYGVIFSGILIFLGWVLHFVFPSRCDGFPTLVLPSRFEDWALWVHCKNPLIVTGLGLLCLLMLPLIRVILTLVWFLWHKDIRFVILTLLVLGMIGIGIWLGKAL